MVQHPSYPRSQIGVGERLEDDLDAGIEASLVDDGVTGVAGRIEDLETWSPSLSLISELPTVHAAGKPDIRE
jgi:hypothetical protein